MTHQEKIRLAVQRELRIIAECTTEIKLQSEELERALDRLAIIHQEERELDDAIARCEQAREAAMRRRECNHPPLYRYHITDTHARCGICQRDLVRTSKTHIDWRVA